ncbi:cytochrome-c peroxidase [Solimonas sp. K1W22B-7]|uniref:cytochrome-c peroxidase n=1 Tax=Solimonas sp. K1W22B-7 TaxID=2303331 RepID=UPI000E32E976|nr:cytochrome c peroxidase [Solimonas sp. K1W22B-7]AXQ28004.1 cytochrome-c peroxidase [Solimonas sp. K1W22B-7]
MIRTRTLATTAAALGLALSAALAAPPAPHGATDFGEQQARLDSLLKGQDPLAPRGFDTHLWPVVVPKDNALTPERVTLGRKLYFDPRLSADGSVACATCHDSGRGFSDQRPVSEGIGDQMGKRSSPTTLNALLFGTQFWDGRAATLEDQAKLPITNPIEMGHKTEAAALAAIAKDPAYIDLFRKAYGRAPNFDDLARAIASFERTLVFFDAPFDRWQAGDAKAISDEAIKGFALFNGKARCAACHMLNSTNPLGTDQRFHNIGVSARKQDFEKLARQALSILARDNSQEQVDRLALETDMSELGRFMVTKNRADIGGFKTSQLRNVGITGPYMHDGTLTTLWDVMDHYNKGGETNPFLDGGIEPLALKEEEIDAVVAFLFTLTDRRFSGENDQAMKAQKSRAAKTRPFRDTRLANRELLPFEERVMGKNGLK